MQIFYAYLVGGKRLLTATGKGKGQKNPGYNDSTLTKKKNLYFTNK